MTAKIITVLCFLVGYTCSCFSQAESTCSLPANTPKVSYVGRTSHHALGEVTFDWVGTYFEFAYRGETFSMQASDTGESYYNVFVDGQLHRILKIYSRDTLVDIVSNLRRDRTHVVRVQKRSEGEFGRTTIHRFIYPKGSFLAEAVPRPGRFMEFIGDSFTVGYGADGTNREEPFSVATENADKTYACILARYFQADYALVAHSGRGAARNYGDSLTRSRYTMKDAMMNRLNSDTASRYHFDQYKPDLVVINLGSNDFSTKPNPSQVEFETAFLQIISQVRAAYGSKVKILCVVSRLKDPVERYIAEIVSRSNDSNLHHTASLEGLLNNGSDMGAAWHPGERGHRKMAAFIAPYIATIMDWSMEDRIIK